MASRSQFYREQEKICLENARRSDDEHIKEQWASLAKQWGFLAEDGERREARW